MADKMKQYKNDGMSEETLRKLGESEAIASLCEDMLRDEAKIREFIQRDMTLGEKVLNFIDTVLKNFKQLLSVDRGSGASAMIADIEQARKLWFDALQAAKEGATAPMGEAIEERKARVQYLVRDEFRSEYEEWVRTGRKEKTIEVGTTPRILVEMGAKEQKLNLHSKNILHALQHAGMSDDIIVQIPQMLEDPIAILKSTNISDKNKREASRIVVYGNVIDENGAPVAAIVELRPLADDGRVINMQLLYNAYGKNYNIGRQFEKSDVMYLNADKNRTNAWMQGLGLQLPSDTTKYGSMGRISYNGRYVKLEGIPYKEIIAKSEETQESKRTEATTESELKERQGFMPDRTVNEDLQKAKAQFERVERMDEDGNKTTVPKIATEIATIIKKNVMHAYKDVSRNLDTFAKGIPEFRKKLQEVIERPLNTASKIQNAAHRR